ncbi:MAG: hypothetical protein CMJ89_15520 [Planctomycetes bacterium]|jgi:long-chain fatty acid transport protein|nr:hypothetical protein [Planctomycetota bacterium]
MGLSAAGAGARARDAATAYTNPAGMTLLEGDHYLFGGYGIVVIQEFEIDPSGTMSDPPGSTDGGGRTEALLPGLGSYVVKQIDEDWRLGLAINAPFVGGSQYDDTWVGRAFVVESNLLGLNFEPSVAYRLDERWSIGLGVNVLYATFESKRRASTDPAAPTVTLDANDVGFGLTLSTMFELRPQTRLGLVYRSPIDLELEGDFDDGAGGKVDAGLEFTLPQGASLSMREEVSSNLSVLADAGWTDWSVFSDQATTIGGSTLELNRHWEDTWRIGVGAEYRLGERWLLQTGIGYDSSAVPDQRLLPDIPFQDSWRYSVGSQYSFGSWSLGLSYTFMDRGNPNIDSVALPPTGTVVLDGEFETSTRHFVGFTISWHPGSAGRH